MPIIVNEEGYTPDNNETTNSSGEELNDSVSRITLGNVSIEPEKTIVVSKPKSPVTIIDEENPIPDNYEGDIIFDKVIYSSYDFTKGVNIGFNELTSTKTKIDVRQFFDLYNELFFEIPKEGENSHSTIIETSMDFVTNYKNPLQDTVDGLYLQLEESDRIIADLQVQLATAQAGDSLAEDIASAAENAQYGNPNDPYMNYSTLQANLYKLYQEGELENDTSNKFENGPKKDLTQAYEKGGQSGIREGVSNRLYSEWREDVDRRSSGKDQDDIYLMLDKTQQNIANGNGESL